MLPSTLPWTPRNLRITGFANRIANFGKAPLTFKVDMYGAGFPEIQGGKLTILEKIGFYNSIIEQAYEIVDHSQSFLNDSIARILSTKKFELWLVLGTNVLPAIAGGTFSFGNVASSLA